METVIFTSTFGRVTHHRSNCCNNNKSQWNKLSVGLRGARGNLQRYERIILQCGGPYRPPPRCEEDRILIKSALNNQLLFNGAVYNIAEYIGGFLENNIRKAPVIIVVAGRAKGFTE